MLLLKAWGSREGNFWKLISLYLYLDDYQLGWTWFQFSFQAFKQHTTAENATAPGVRRKTGKGWGETARTVHPRGICWFLKAPEAIHAAQQEGNNLAMKRYFPFLNHGIISFSAHKDISFWQQHFHPVSQSIHSLTSLIYSFNTHRDLLCVGHCPGCWEFNSEQITCTGTRMRTHTHTHHCQALHRRIHSASTSLRTHRALARQASSALSRLSEPTLIHRGQLLRASQ